MSANPLAVACHALRKTYQPRRQPPVEALVGLELEVRVGECFGMLGPNGAGKTTTVEILEGLLTPTSGHVEVLGMQWGTDDDRLRQRIGVTLQETNLTDKLTVHETLRLFRSFYHKGAEPDDVLQSVALNEKRNARLDTLSGGQKQRLAVACALVGEPELLFLDEPTTGLDPKSRRDIWDIIRQHRQQGRTTLITTHYMDEAERLCDRVAVVDRGKVIALGSPAELISRVGGEHVIEFAVQEGQPGVRLLSDAFADLPTVRDCRHEADGFVLTVGAPHECIPALVHRLSDGRLELTRLTTRHVSLEDVFVRLTGRHLTDAELADAAR